MPLQMPLCSRGLDGVSLIALTSIHVTTSYKSNVDGRESMSVTCMRGKEPPRFSAMQGKCGTELKRKIGVSSDDGGTSWDMR